MRIALVLVLAVAIGLGTFGCAGYKVSKPYVGTMTRVDQNLQTGNRGYLAGTAPEPGERKLTRQLITMDVDVPDRVSDKPIDTIAGRPGITKTAEPGDVVPTNKASRYDSVASSEERVQEINREVTVVREETPTMVKTTTVVTEEDIK